MEIIKDFLTELEALEEYSGPTLYDIACCHVFRFSVPKNSWTSVDYCKIKNEMNDYSG
jgi:hypothetical protein